MEIFGQTASLVSEGTGSLVYHLVLLFALGTAAAIAVGRWWETRQPAAARLATGASALFVLRLAGLVIALLAALITTLNPLVLLPPFDRAASTLTLLFIIWIAAFPRPSRPAEAATALLSVLVILALIISWGLWAQEALAQGFYNGRPQETVWEFVQMGLLGAGLILLALRRPRDWVLGLALLLILLAGHVIHYVLPIAGSSIPGAERLAEILAAPLLVALMYRRAHAAAPAVPTAPEAPAADLADLTLPAYSQRPEQPLTDEDTGPLPVLDRALVVPQLPLAPVLDARAALSLAALGSAAGPREFGEKLVMAAAHGLGAPLALFLTPDKKRGGLSVSNAYQLVGQRSLLGGFRVAVDEPDLLTELEHADTLPWQPTEAENELRDLARAAGVTDPSRLLLAPVRAAHAEGALVAVLAVAPPGPADEWAGQSQHLLEGLARAGGAAWSAVAERARAALALDEATSRLATTQVELERSREMAEALSNQLQLQRRAEPVQAEQIQALEAERAQFQLVHNELDQRKLQEQVLRAELEMTRTALAVSSQESAKAVTLATDDLQGQLDALTQQLEARTAEHTEQQALAQRLATELEEARAALTQANADAATVANLAAAREAPGSEADDLRARLQALLGDYEEQQAVVQRLQAELEQVRAQMVQASQSAAAALDTQRQEADSLRATLEDMQGDHELRQTLTERLSAELEQARAALAAHSPDDDSEQPSVPALLRNLAAAEAQLTEHASELESLRQALAESERQRAAAVVALASASPTATVGKPLQTADMEVIASVTQELRQPMSSIVGYADLLLSESVGIIGALQRKFLERIKASSERIGVLLDDLMRVMDIDSGNLRLAHESVDVMRVVDDALHGSESLYQGKNLKLTASVPPSVPPIQADRDALLQIFTHLLNNAGAASSSDSEVTLTLKVETDRRTGGEEMHYLVVSITDTGGGIAPEDQPRVFSRLYRADAPLIAGLGDNGMGLSIAKALVEGHGGRIWVISEAGRGSTFYVLLPLEGKHAKVNGTVER